MRKTILILLIVLVLFSLFQGVLRENTVKADSKPIIWPMFRYNPQHTGQCPYNTSNNNGTLKWKFETGNKIYSSPAIASDGTIYVGSEDSYICAMSEVPSILQDADTGGMQYANWYFGQNNLKEVNVVIDINNDPLTEDGLYFQAYDAYINGRMFYFGIQTRVFKQGYGLVGKGLIFSEFETTDLSSLKLAPGGWYGTGTNEDLYVGGRISYEWTNHKYALTVKYKESDSVGDWYDFWIEDLIANVKTFAGALRFPFPKDLSKEGITDGGGTWTELYYRKVNGSSLPEWKISILEVSAISKDGTIIFPKSAYLKNADNFYHIDQVFHSENDNLDFIIGGKVTKSFDGKSIALGTGSINVNATLSGSMWSNKISFSITREKTYNFSSVPVSLSNCPIGIYKIAYNSPGFLNVTLISITPSITQLLTKGNTITFTMNFKPGSPIINVTVGLGGFVFPSGQISITPGSSQTFTITPNTGYKIKDVKVDGVSVGAVSTYTFSNVTSDHTIEASFEAITFTITASAGSGGYISPSGTVTINYGESKTFTITPYSGYKISNVKVDGVSVGAVSKYTFQNVTANHTIEASFEKEINQIVIVLQVGNSAFAVNGETRYLDSPPIVKNGRTLVPIRAIIEALGGTVQWNPNEKRVDIILGNNHLILQIGNPNAYVNGVQKFIDASNIKVYPEIINGRTMLPLRFVAENLGCDVQWDGTTKTITITYTGG